MSGEVVAVRDAVARLAVLKVLRDRVNAVYEQARTEAGKLLAEGDRITAMVEGRKVGAVTAVAGTVRAMVTDDLAFTAWVGKRYPLELVTSVRPAFHDALLKRVAAQATPGDVPADPQTGERIPGVQVVASAGYLRVTPVADAPLVLGRQPETVRAALGAALDGGQ